jgi:CRP-like cAMP-binding protein
MFLLFKGRARHFYLTPEGKKIVLFWLAPGQIFGAAAVLPADSVPGGNRNTEGQLPLGLAS